VAAYLAVTSVPAVSATYAIDADGTSASTFTIYTGSQNVSASYEFASINGTAAVNYWPQVLDVSFLVPFFFLSLFCLTSKIQNS